MLALEASSAPATIVAGHLRQLILTSHPFIKGAKYLTKTLTRSPLSKFLKKVEAIITIFLS